MAYELIAAIVLAIGVGGMVVLLRKMSGGRIPKTTLPIAIALALIGFAVWGDYSWASRTQGALPDRLTVVDEQTESNMWRPWTYLVPLTERMIVVDTGSVRRNPAMPGTALVDFFFFERRLPTRQLPVLVDCEESRSALIGNVADLSEETMDSLDWTDLPDGNRLIPAVCTV